MGEMLYTIGWVYVNRAQQFFAGGMMRRTLAKVEGQMHLASSKAKLANSVGRTYFIVNGIMKTAEKKRKSLDSGKAKDETAKQEGEGEAKKDEPTQEATASSDAGVADPVRGSGDEVEEEKEAPVLPNIFVCEGPSSDRELLIDGGLASPRDDREQQSIDAQRNSSTAPANVGAEECGSPDRDESEPNDDIMVGSLVVIQALQRSSELNNEVGVVVGVDS